jgi:hypothetical protein
MVRAVTFVSVLTVLVCGLATDATAQPYIRPSRFTPAAEVAVVTSGASFFELARVGARVTINRSDWFGTETSLEAKKATSFGSAQGMLMVNARLIVPSDDTRDPLLVLTAGGAVGTGLRQTLSPVIGAGIQKSLDDPSFAVRVDFQYFPVGLLRTRSNWRTMVGFAMLLH